MSVNKNPAEFLFLRERIKAKGFTIKGFCELLNRRHPCPEYAIRPETMSRALHRSRGTRAENYLRRITEQELKRLEAFKI